MYYHSRDLKLVEYGKVFPMPNSVLVKKDKFIINIYNWLGNYCGFSPQIWLSRSKSKITGYRTTKSYTKRHRTYQKNGKTFYKNETKFFTKSNDILFGFDTIKGFPVNYDPWEFLIPMIAERETFKEQNLHITNEMNYLFQSMKEDYGEEFEIECKDDILIDWNQSNSLDEFLKNVLFIENDQVVVPSLNLKSAKKIICSNEKQKKALRKIGFIEDRIEIKNLKKKM